MESPYIRFTLNEYVWKDLAVIPSQANEILKQIESCILILFDQQDL